MDPIDMSGFKPIATGTPPKGPGAIARTEAARLSGAKSGGAGEVALSGLASAGEAAPVNLQRVSEIRQAIEQGRYPFDAAKIADALIGAGYLVRIRP